MSKKKIKNTKNQMSARQRQIEEERKKQEDFIKTMKIIGVLIFIIVLVILFTAERIIVISKNIVDFETMSLNINGTTTIATSEIEYKDLEIGEIYQARLLLIDDYGNNLSMHGEVNDGVVQFTPQEESGKISVDIDIIENEYYAHQNEFDNSKVLQTITTTK